MVGDIATTAYYTFSTVAQSVAAMCGVLAAVTLYRIQNMDSELRAISADLAGPLLADKHEETSKALAAQNYYWLLDSIIKSNHLAYRTTTFEVRLHRFSHLIFARRAVINTFTLAFGAAVLTVITSCLFLTTIHKHVALLQWFLAMSLGMVFLCGFLFYLLMRKLLA